MKLEKEFNEYLSNLAVMTFKLHNIHWNVEGMQFTAVHSFTEGMYENTFEFLDAVAELEKMYETMPVSTVKEYLELATIKEVPAKKFTPVESFEILLGDVEILRKQATELRNACEAEGWFSSQAVFEEQIEYYNKQIWFIKATLG
ncbi:MAG: DNA starvation/stationary phase protection protein [Clostridiales bacterium]|nr:DNA starvation/stationary phase protection protein [Clostridiales bacterium]MBS5877540.1 DNA starvation/stationary phase protection protein [Clostridiales bacterium]MDU0939741.1 DNA starvation/stationary phase protection protein [Clostridiales bacterium]MDU1042109.1 DNA starvation/stationary phase protection protein [Clostridiales bacterium]